MRTTITQILSLLLGVTFFQTANAHDYYPLAVGNEWFYRIVGLPPNDSTISSSVRVVRDTVLLNGHRYFILSQNDIMGSKYVRTDSSSVYYLNPYLGQEERVFKLDGQVGDTLHIVGWGPYAIVRLSRVDTLMVLGRRLRMITFGIDGLLYAQMRFCERFGPMTEWR
jgi:hypothetical protein